MTSSRRRLDQELVRRKIARSREQARDMITDGIVTVNGFLASKPATQVDETASIKITRIVDDYASRGAHKLVGALEEFIPQGLNVDGARVLDAGASTGGFTDVLLRHGAQHVVAVDVGYGQLIQRLATDSRVTVCDRTNIRDITPETLGGHVDMMVGDLSFISLRLVLPAVMSCVRPGGSLLPMVKPQFEVGKDQLPKGAVVKDPALRAAATIDVACHAETLGLSCRGVVASPLPGPAGNVEYFLWLVHDELASHPGRTAVADMVTAAVAKGPSPQ